MRERDTMYWLVALFGVSALAHALAWVALGLLPAIEDLAHRREQPIEIGMIVEPAPEAPVPEPPEPEIAPEPERAPAQERPRIRAPEPEPEPEQLPPPPPDLPLDEPPAAEEAIEDFTGMTIEGESAAWASPVGNGLSSDRPIGQPGAQRTGRRREGVVGGQLGGGGAPVAEPGPRVVAFADLSRRPSPHGDLDALLSRNYPARARQLGIEGRVIVGFRIMPDGSLARLRVRTEAPLEHGFGQACRRTVEQIRWDPPLARDGQPVATDASFECEFVVGLN